MDDGSLAEKPPFSLAHSSQFLTVVACIVVGLFLSLALTWLHDWYYRGHRRQFKAYKFPYGGYTAPFPGQQAKWPKEAKIDGTALHVYSHPPERKAKAIFIFVHNLGTYVWNRFNIQHSDQSWWMDYFAHIGESLANHDILTVGFDLPGHGKSGGWRGHIGSHERIIEAATSLARTTLQKIRRRQDDLNGKGGEEEAKADNTETDEGIPVYIGGLGFGALVSTMCAHRHPEIFKGVAVFSPHSEKKKKKKKKKRRGGGSCSSNEGDGNISVNIPIYSLQKDVFGSYSVLIPVFSTLLPYLRMWGSSDAMNKQSRNIAVIRAHKNDPLVTCRYLTWSTMRERQLLTRKVSAIIPKLKVPLLYIQGLQDMISDPSGYVAWHGWHNMFVEPEATHVLDRLLNWIRKDLEWRFLESTLD
eukprot:jgi/Bigna1/132290/aug1.17_g6998